MTWLRPLSESDCYSRLYGDRDTAVSVIRESSPERPSGGLLGEQLLRLYEQQLDRERDFPEVEAA